MKISKSNNDACPDCETAFDDNGLCACKAFQRLQKLIEENKKQQELLEKVIQEIHD